MSSSSSSSLSSSSAFERLTNTVLESAEQIANRIEEGLNVIMTGSISGEPQQGSSSSSSSNAHNNNHHHHDTTTDPDMMMDMDMDMDDDMMGSPLEGIADGVLKDLMNRGIGPQTAWEHVQAFCAAIRWTEPFIVSLILFQIIMFGLSYYVSRKGGAMVPRLMVMVTIGILVRSAEYANAIAGRHWETTLGTTQNYFDRNGIFVGIMFCAPLLLDCFMMLTMLIREASTLLIDVKRMEIKRKSKTTQTNDKKNSNNNNNNSSRRETEHDTVANNTRGKKNKAIKDD